MIANVIYGNDDANKIIDGCIYDWISVSASSARRMSNRPTRTRCRLVVGHSFFPFVAAQTTFLAFRA